MTLDDGNLLSKTIYIGNDIVKVGDGTLLPIAHVGTLLLSSPHYPLSLQIGLHVLKLQHNLLFVRQLCRDNHCTVEFDSSSFRVKDNTTGVLLQASSASPIYTVPGSIRLAFVPTNAALTESTYVWYRRFGHYRANVLDTLRKNSLVHFKSVFSNTYTTCRLVKSHKLSFTLAEHRTNSPL